MLSVILPVHNEEENLKRNFYKIYKSFVGLGEKFEIIIAEDGSTDNSPKICEKFKKEFKNVRHIHSNTKLGKGKALTNAILKSKGNKICFMDIDLSADLRHIKKIIKCLETNDICIGSRYSRRSKRFGSMKRLLLSRVYNFLVRMVLGSKISDHQCGFKAFRKKSVLPILKRMKSKSFFWDTEMLVLAQRARLKIKEIPVVWREGKDTRVDVIKDSISMFYGIIELRKRLSKGL
ncbi:MAG: glycosyltransferase [Candidatus Aenigmarchaeota archaeon]|nr:glycosyltransferase [Candidatus Aenigmarchaeota archaeon]